VHHGGCGTTAASLRAGRPTVITPTRFDQYYWGARVQKLGVGVATQHLSKLSAADLAEAVRACMTPAVRQNAADLGVRLRAEELGAERTATWLADYAKVTAATGQWRRLPTPPEALAQTQRRGNLALGMPASASSAKSAERAALLAVDGKPWTRWTSAYRDQQWICVDLGQVRAISAVEVVWEKAHARKYQLQASLNGSEWQTLADEEGHEGYVLSKLPARSEARWVRVYCPARATPYGFSIWELNVFE